MAIAESIRRSPVGRRTVLMAITLRVLDLGNPGSGNPGSVFRRRTHLFDIDVFALGFIRGTDARRDTDARVLFRKRGIPASMTPRPPGKEEEEPDGLSLAPLALGGCHGGQRDSQSADHACSPCAGNQINGQKIPASRLALDMDAPQHQQGVGEVFQQL